VVKKILILTVTVGIREKYPIRTVTVGMREKIPYLHRYGANNREKNPYLHRHGVCLQAL
jgi:hypothetical protein